MWRPTGICLCIAVASSESAGRSWSRRSGHGRAHRPLPGLGADKRPSGDREQRAEREEGEIPCCLVPGLANVVNPKDVMVDQTLNEVEEAPADEQPTHECTTTDRPAPIGCASPEDPEADQHCAPCRGVEQAIPKHVGLQAGDSRFRVAAFAAEHVVPLEDLVEDDPVYEAAEADADQDSGGAGARDRLRGADRWVRSLCGRQGAVSARRRFGKNAPRRAASGARVADNRSPSPWPAPLSLGWSRCPGVSYRALRRIVDAKCREASVRLAFGEDFHTSV